MRKTTMCRRSLCLALILALVSSCAAKAQDSTSHPNPTLRKAWLSVGATTISAEIAGTEDERAKGLMFRNKLADGEGMLFVFETDQVLSFWMKNTILPLSLAYLSSDGQIVKILDLEPQSLAPRSSERSVRYALEVPRGWFGRAGVSVGDVVEIPPLR
ncbi:MAG: DUF192 domain-containing protein [Spirochaetaceae bacterium]|nr:DUF192 domain-containing protein [Spirochaetaceae bacterium]